MCSVKQVNVAGTDSLSFKSEEISNRSEEACQTFYRLMQALSFKTSTQLCLNDFSINKGK